VVWSHPALYVSGDRVVTYTQFDVPWADPYANTFELVVRGQALAGGLTKFNLWATNQPLSRHWTVTAVADAPLPANRVDFFNPLTIHWSYGVPGRAPFLPAGTSSNQVYVTWKQPTTTNLFHTVLDVACRNAVGQTLESNIVASIWSDFADLEVRRWDGSGPMRYWGPKAFEQPFMFTADLVREADGRCGAWLQFFKDVLGAHGVPSAIHLIRPPDGFKVLLIYESLPGQGGTPLRRDFWNHTVNSYGGILYDPSYGTNYTSKLAWEDASVEFFANPLTPDTKGVLQTRFEPDFP